LVILPYFVLIYFDKSICMALLEPAAIVKPVVLVRSWQPYLPASAKCKFRLVVAQPRREPVISYNGVEICSRHTSRIKLLFDRAIQKLAFQ
jgi:hypothetical protein